MGRFENGSAPKKNGWLVPVLCIGIVICLAVTVWALFFRKPAVVLTPDYAPVETEAYAEAIPDDNSEKAEAPQGGGSISIQYMDQVTIDLSDKKAALEYANPGSSTQDIVLQIVIQGEIVAQSGTINPGKQVKELELLSGTEKMLQPGTYTDAKYVILSYHPETGEKAMVNTEAAITVTVQN